MREDDVQGLEDDEGMQMIKIRRAGAEGDAVEEEEMLER